MTCHRVCLTSVAFLLSLTGPAGLEGQTAMIRSLPVQGGEEHRTGRHASGPDVFKVSSVQRPASPPETSSRSWWTLWSTNSGQDRIFLGMWTFHPFGDDPYPRESNNGFGVQYRSVFAFTCVNSFERRTYALGVERVWTEARRGPFGAMLGFRVGLIHGYDTELFRVAGETPVLPFAGTVALFRVGPVGGEVSWVYQAVSLVGAVFF
jgi:hypothetical protein